MYSSPLAVIKINNKDYLHIFSIELLIQRETLDYALITSMKSAKLHPLVGRISGKQNKKKHLCLKVTVNVQHNANSKFSS